MISFKEVTNSVGIFNQGLSYGASWGDFNGDKYPDLWVSNHFPWQFNDSFNYVGTLYLNQRDGTFANITSQAFFPQPQLGDRHGGAWADFDNDGDQDLIVLVGAVQGTESGSNQFYVNEGGVLEERASELGIDYSLSRGRTPLWFDLDQDGLLDIFLGAEARPDGQSPPAIFKQNDSGFEDISVAIDFNETEAEFAFVSDLSGDGNLDAVFKSTPLSVYDSSDNSFEDITNTLIFDAIQSKDVVSGDFNGDLRPDLYLTRGSKFFTSNLVQDSLKIAKARIVSEGDQKGIQFDSSGAVRFSLDIGSKPALYPPIYIGAEGFSPNDLDFTLSPDAPEVEGILPHTPGEDRGIYIGYDSTSQQWQILVSSSDRLNLRTRIETTEPISDLTAIGFDPNTVPRNDQLLINTENGLIDQSQAAGINAIPVAGNSVVTGDFDNDMDLDLYIVTTNHAGNLPNILYENQGDGTFLAVPDVGGAEGTNLGLGDSVVTADYDLDGFLDLFVTNGEGVPLLNFDAPSQLFRNQGNSNHWLEIDLEGVVSNRDGIGAQVFVTAGGVTQLREQSGGIHHKSQNHQRLHFGLADNTKIDEILIKWPNGQEQIINNVAVDQLLQVIEPSESFVPGKPDYAVASESGVFLWKDTFDGPYHLRTVGSQGLSQFSVNLIATDGLLELNPFSLETDDDLATTEFGFSFDSQVFGGQDGLDFRLAPGAQALFSVTQDGVANPRQLNMGKEATPLSPDGWIINSEEFAQRPEYTTGVDLGLFIGQGNSTEKLEFRWNADEYFHHTNLSVLSSEDMASFSAVRLESNDKLTNLNNGVKIESTIKNYWDGLDVTVPEPVNIGFAYEQDSLLQPHRVNANLQDGFLNDPNAYWLPLATPYGQPEYNPSEESGLFLWKEEQGLWHLRVTGGTDTSNRYIGSIVSDSPATFVNGVGIEPNDQININDPLRIDFDLRVFTGYQDGIDFSFPENASLSINLQEATEEAASLFNIGSERWSVSSLPLDISGW